MRYKGFGYFKIGQDKKVNNLVDLCVRIKNRVSWTPCKSILHSKDTNSNRKFEIFHLICRGFVICIRINPGNDQEEGGLFTIFRIFWMILFPNKVYLHRIQPVEVDKRPVERVTSLDFNSLTLNELTNIEFQCFRSSDFNLKAKLFISEG